MKDHSFFMRKAIQLAKENANSMAGGPFGAIIVKDGEIISSATNKVTVDNDPTSHAEINAIRSACRKLKTFDLTGCVLYSSCEPCPMCLSASYWAHLDKIFYAADKADAAKAGFDDDFIYEELSLPIGERKMKMERLLPAEGEEPFDLWTDNKNKVSY